MTQPTQNSQNGSSSQLEDVARQLKERCNVDYHSLAVLMLAPNEMVLGEVMNLNPDARDIAEKKAIVKNPKRLTRINIVGREGVNVDIRLSDFDFISEGEIQLKAIGGFFLSWLNEESALRYAHGYLGFEEGRRLASARQAGIELPEAPKPPILIR